jgi:hypothetical protein
VSLNHKQAKKIISFFIIPSKPCGKGITSFFVIIVKVNTHTKFCLQNFFRNIFIEYEGVLCIYEKRGSKRDKIRNLTTLKYFTKCLMCI